jgi:hypothetical protein
MPASVGSEAGIMEELDLEAFPLSDSFYVFQHGDTSSFSISFARSHVRISDYILGCQEPRGALHGRMSLFFSTMREIGTGHASS